MSAGIIQRYAGKENVQIINLKVISSNGKGGMRNIARALEYVKAWDEKNKDNPVDIVLMTLGSPTRHEQTESLLHDLGKNKVLICSAANNGQTNANSVLSPAKNGSVIAIGSCNEDGDRCSHSSVGQELAFLMPGERIQSTSSKYSISSSLYVTKSGTSFAAPHCAALVALILGYVEAYCALDNKNGATCRKSLTQSLQMKDLMREEFGGMTHSYDRGFGIPQIKRVEKHRIMAFLEKAK